ncbi:hypothetical protein A3H26_01945 [candidate division WWE3 bacterium RIFCSPLOWO2_12_FULL_36_10]|uniref:Response regulatory domain-containing protein n=1 Tax=candidate division WWE3 bacterium RIFCSPLOWO2_12_FULL_36_10 TaxID=1802630 RepID=A0A1F4VHU9_UNCKA|nr:MAG: hypothetical protein A3H26_01945 [candidate division WWE3 bacterium RIFCSPLOWO2_12_FULL_36_10]
MNKILIVEDDEALATLYKAELELKNYEVSVVSNGSLVLSEVRKLMPDLVLLDIMLPGKNGLEILQEIRADEKLKDVKVIMLTNFGSEENVSTALEFGAVDYIMKYKIVPSELTDRVAVVLGHENNPVVKVTN